MIRIKPPSAESYSHIAPMFSHLAGKLSGECAVIGEGPSAELSRNVKCPRIGVNRTKLLGVDLDFWIAQDPMPNILEDVFHQCWYRYETVTFKDPKWVERNGKIRAGISIIRAISIAYQLGFNRILLFGVDLGADDKGRFYFDSINELYCKEPWPTRCGREFHIKDMIIDTVVTLMKKNIEILDMSPGARIIEGVKQASMADAARR